VDGVLLTKDEALVEVEGMTGKEGLAARPTGEAVGVVYVVVDLHDHVSGGDLVVARRAVVNSDQSVWAYTHKLNFT